MAKGKSANIDTNSHYTFGVAYDFGMLWKQRGFLTSSEQLIKNGIQVAELLAVILLHSVLAIIKVSGHTKADTTEAKSNSLADHDAKTEALQMIIVNSQLFSLFSLTVTLPIPC